MIFLLDWNTISEFSLFQTFSVKNNSSGHGHTFDKSDRVWSWRGTNIGSSSRLIYLSGVVQGDCDYAIISVIWDIETDAYGQISSRFLVFTYSGINPMAAGHVLCLDESKEKSIRYWKNCGLWTHREGMKV